MKCKTCGEKIRWGDRVYHRRYVNAMPRCFKPSLEYEDRICRIVLEKHGQLIKRSDGSYPSWAVEEVTQND